jgi:hypothetical protein
MRERLGFVMVARQACSQPNKEVIMYYENYHTGAVVEHPKDWDAYITTSDYLNDCTARAIELLDLAYGEIGRDYWFDALLDIESAVKLIAVQLRDCDTTNMKRRAEAMLNKIWRDAFLNWDANERLVQVRWLLSMC